MTTSTTTIDVSAFTTDAKFRAWGAAVSAALLAAGLTQTADSGQINWTTVTKPVATLTKAGYEIWRFNDALQATKPIFIRIDYGSNTVASGNGPNTWITVGTGTDGAGVITGPNTGALQHGGSTVAPTNVSTIVQACYSASQGALYLGAGLNLVAAAANHGGFYVVARTCDTAGAPTGDGVVVYRQATVASLVLKVAGINFNTSVAYTDQNVAAGVLRNASFATGSTVQLYKNYAALGVLYPLNQVITYYTSDIAAQTTFVATPWGVSSHTYMAMGTLIATAAEGQALAGAIPAVLWE